MAVHITLTVDGSSRVGLEEGAKKIAVRLKPEWKEDNLQFQVRKLTNNTFKFCLTS